MKEKYDLLFNLENIKYKNGYPFSRSQETE